MEKIEVQRVRDLTVDEFKQLLREALREVLQNLQPRVGESDRTGKVKEERSKGFDLPVVDVGEFLEDEGQKFTDLSNFPVDDLGPWPESLSLRREDMYGDDGR